MTSLFPMEPKKLTIFDEKLTLQTGENKNKNSNTSSMSSDERKKKLDLLLGKKPVEEKSEASSSAAPESATNAPKKAPVEKVPNKILSQEDFDRLERLKKRYINKVRMVESDSDEEEEDSESEEKQEGPFNFIDPDNLAVAYKHKITEEEKAAIAKEKKELRDEMFEHKRGTTNKVKARKKPFMMKSVGQRAQRLSETKKHRKAKGKRKQVGKFSKLFGKSGGKSGFRR